jgi:predicted membrane protein
MASSPSAPPPLDDKDKSTTVLHNFEVALASITKQLEPLLAVPWQTIVTR